MAEKLVIELTREKETPGTVRFQEQDPTRTPRSGRCMSRRRPASGSATRRASG